MGAEENIDVLEGHEEKALSLPVGTYFLEVLVEGGWAVEKEEVAMEASMEMKRSD